MWRRNILRRSDSVEKVRAIGVSFKIIYSNLDILFLSSSGKKKHFKLDPKFPSLLFKSGFDTTLYFLQSLLEDYSNRTLSEPTDRHVALSGLAARIAKALNCEESYGIFGLYLHRNLLWQRSGLLERIAYKPPAVPSWSWMAYTGGIKFMDIDVFKLDLFKNLKFYGDNKQALITDVWKFRGDLKAKEQSEAVSRRILDSYGKERGWIVYDVKGEEDLASKRSVVVGRTGSEDQSKYYMLIVKQREGNQSEFERVGIGMVQKGYISRRQADVCVF